LHSDPSFQILKKFEPASATSAGSTLRTNLRPMLEHFKRETGPCRRRNSIEK
jgi:hypothetical protein